MAALMIRFVFLLLIARAVAAPIGLRPLRAEQVAPQGASFRFLDAKTLVALVTLRPLQADPATCQGVLFRFLDAEAIASSVAFRPEMDGRPGPGALVFRVCSWPFQKNPRGSTELVQCRVKSRTVARFVPASSSPAESTLALLRSHFSAVLSTDRYLRQSLGRLRC